MKQIITWSNNKIKRKGILDPVCGFCFLCIFLFSCKSKITLPQYTSKDISAVTTKMTDIMLHDITNPPLAARFFAYSCLSGYEVVVQNDASFKSMYGKLNGYPEIKKPEVIQPFSFELAALFAMMETAKKMQPSGKMIQDFEDNFAKLSGTAGN